MENTLVIVVTGTNRGVGRGIVQILAQQQHWRRLIIYATSRSGADTHIEVLPPNIVRYRKLDTTSVLSIQEFLDSVRNEDGVIDILINNAAVSNDHRETPEFAAETVRNNYGGTKRICEAFLSGANMSRNPPYSRIVNLTSGFNNLSAYGPGVQEKFRAIESTSDIDALAESYLRAVAAGPETQVAGGWGTGPRSYKISKALIMGLSILLAKQNPDVMVNCCCPGWTDTDMGNRAPGNMKPPKTAEEGARIAVRLAIGDLGSGGNSDGGLMKGGESERVTGMFFENESIVEKGWGKSKAWVET